MTHVSRWGSHPIIVAGIQLLIRWPYRVHRLSLRGRGNHLVHLRRGRGRSHKVIAHRRLIGGVGIQDRGLNRNIRRLLRKESHRGSGVNDLELFILRLRWLLCKE